LYTNDRPRNAAENMAAGPEPVSAPAFIRPGTLADAVAALATPGIGIIAGGTDYFPALGDRVTAGPVLDLSGIGELAGIAVDANEVRIGGATRWTQVIRATLSPEFDALKAAARDVGSIQIQNRGTVAGNLCNASPAADGVPPLLALDARVELISPTGTRSMPLGQFITGNRKTQRRPDEILSAIVIPRTIAGPSVFLKLGARRYLVISIAMVAAILEDDGVGRIGQARIAVGSCSAVAQRMGQLERELVGQRFGPGIGAIVEPRHLNALTPIDDVRATAAYRLDAARTLVARAIERCVERSAT
jgi:CO/xanthine dehydrogenase FAD-binding subunit